MGRHNSGQRGALPTPEIRPDDSTLTRFAGAVPLITFMTEELGLVSENRFMACDIVVDYCNDVLG